MSERGHEEHLWTVGLMGQAARVDGQVRGTDPGRLGCVPVGFRYGGAPQSGEVPRSSSR